MLNVLVKLAVVVILVGSAVALVANSLKPVTIHVSPDGRLMVPEKEPRLVPVVPVDPYKPTPDVRPYPYRPGSLDSGSASPKGEKK